MWINSESICDFQELDDIEPPFAFFYFGYCRLCFAEQFSKLSLFETGCLPGLSQIA